MIAELTLTATPGQDAPTSGMTGEDTGQEFAAILAPLASDGAETAEAGEAAPAAAPQAGKAAQHAEKAATKAENAAPLAASALLDTDIAETVEAAPVAAPDAIEIDAQPNTETPTEFAVSLPPAAPLADAPVSTATPSVDLPDGPQAAAMDGKPLPPGGNFSQQSTTDRVPGNSTEPTLPVDGARPTAIAETVATAAQTTRAEPAVESRAVPIPAPAMPAPATDSDTSSSAANGRPAVQAEPFDRITSLRNTTADARPAETAPRQAAETTAQLRTLSEAVSQAAVAGPATPDTDAANTPTERTPMSAVLAELRTGERPLTDRSPIDRATTDPAAAERGMRLAISQAAGQPGWGEEIRGNLQWLSRQGIHRAELQLHPAELGSIDVRITTENDQASVLFVAANRAARELLEAELPRLRELFSQVGVELGQAEVADREQPERGFTAGDTQLDQGHKSAIKDTGEDADNPVEAMGSLAVGPDTTRGLIDYYI